MSRNHHTRFRAACRLHLDEPFETESPDAYLLHMREHGKRRMSATGNPASIRRMWRTPTPRPFVVESFDVGDWIAWADPKTETTRHGQVWSLHPRGKDTRWVADGTTYIVVHRSQLVARPWSASSAAA